MTMYEKIQYLCDESSIKLAHLCKEARFVGWDIAIGNDGPVFIEANNSCSETLYQFDGGKWDYFLKQK